MSSRIELKQLITEDTLLAMGKLENLLTEKEDKEFINILLVIKGNYNELEKNNRSGIVGIEDYHREINRINLNVLKIMDDIPAFYFDKPSEHQADEEFSRSEFEIAALIRELGELEIREAELFQPNSKGYINSKRHIIAMQLVRMIEKTKVSVSSLEYSMIAYSFYRNVDIVKAEQMYKKAIENIDSYADSAQSKINAIRSYANFLYNINRFEDGAKQYESALLEGDTEANNFINGFTYQMKFANECGIADYNSAVISYKKAKEYYLNIKNSSNRLHNLNGLSNVWDAQNMPPGFIKP